MADTFSPNAAKDEAARKEALGGKQLADRVSNTSEEMAEYAWRYALADRNRKAHERK